MTLPIRQVVEYSRVYPDVAVPFYATDKAAGFDLETAEDALFTYLNEIQLVSTGLVIKTPPEHMLYITFRSSTPHKYDVTILGGIIDEDYSGPEDVVHLQVQRIGFAQGPIFLPAGSRIAQGIFIPVMQGRFLEIEPNGESRGGFGSTG